MTAADPLGAWLARAVRAGGRPSSDFDLNPSVVLPEGRKLRAAAVLIAVDDTRSAPVIWLTKRSSALKHHPGQIALPGGKVDPGDADATAAALREASEEIALPSACLRVVGTLEPHETVTGFVITPVLARVLERFEPRPEVGEVAEVFAVPISHVLDPTRYQVMARRWRGQQRRYYAAPWGPYYIWGATALILQALATRMAP